MNTHFDAPIRSVTSDLGGGSVPRKQLNWAKMMNFVKLPKFKGVNVQTGAPYGCFVYQAFLYGP